MLSDLPGPVHRRPLLIGGDAPHRPPWRNVVRELGRDVFVPVIVTAFVALALIPVPRPLAWVTLLGLAAGLGAVTRATGVTSAVAGGFMYMTAHGRPRLAAVVTDQSTIRLSFLLALLGALAAVLVDRRRHRPAAKARPSPPTRRPS